MPQMSPMNWMTLSMMMMTSIMMTSLLADQQSQSPNNTLKNMLMSKKWMW